MAVPVGKIGWSYWKFLTCLECDKRWEAKTSLYRHVFFLSVNIYKIWCSLVFPPIGLKVSSFSCRASGSTFVWAHCSSCRHCPGLMVGQKTRDGQGESWRLQGSEIDLLQLWSLSLNLAGCLQPCSKCGCWPQRATGQHGMFQSSNLTVFVCWVITGRVSSAILDFLNTAESTRRWSWVEMPRHVWEHTSRRIQKRRVIKSVEDSATIVPNYFFAAEISLVVSCDRSQIMESFCFLYFCCCWQKSSGTSFILWQTSSQCWKVSTEG